MILSTALYTSRVLQTSIEEKTQYLFRIRDDPSFKGAFGLTMTQVLYFNQKISKNSQVKVCKDTVMMTPLAIYTQKDFYLNDEINNLIEQFKAGGLIDFWRYQELEKRKIVDDGKNSPKVLTLNQLLGSFEILLLGVVFSCFVFVCEILRKAFLAPKKVKISLKKIICKLRSF